MSLKRIVVTGANGFIGRHLCTALVEAGKEVTACIREKADASVFGKLSSPLRICRLPSLELGADLSEGFQGADVVIHLAGRAHVMRETSEDPLREFRRVNVTGTDVVASFALRAGARRFIYLSSIKVNGEATRESAFCADDEPNYSDPYGQSKWEAEEHLQRVARESNMEWVIVRPPLVYGPGVRGNFLELMKGVFRGIPLPVGSVHNKRSMVSVYNLCDLLCLLVDHPAAANERFVVSDSEDICTPDLVRLIALALHRPARIMNCPELLLLMAGTMLGKKAAVQRLCSSLVVDREKTRAVLGWCAPIAVDCGLNRTAEWFINRFAGR
jgi:nucleoside-diphosphate-sugar epimerase